MGRIVICISGLSGAGKTGVTRKLKVKINAEEFSLGAICRAICFYMELNKITVYDKAIVNTIMKDPLAWRIIEGITCDPKIQNEKYARGASKLFQIPEVSRWCTEFLRMQPYSIGTKPIIFEGRGSGWLFPLAPVNVWLDADEMVRFMRKYKDAIKLDANTNFSDLVKSLSMRDGFEARNAIMPAKYMPGAVRIDTTHMTEDNVVAEIAKIYNRKIK
ncbi:MAG: (d)CMP kinase [Alphaproteobacteria bacterium]|nr:(d)CMP kinase [Alphaproteobacteria bacterium]